MVSLALVRRYGAHATASHAQDCPDQKLERTLLSSIFIPENLLSLALAGRYSAHATASNAQDCPDLRPENMYDHMHVLMCLFQECPPIPVLGRRYSAHATASYAQDCPD